MIYRRLNINLTQYCSITKAETKIKDLQTMVSNLEKAEAEKQATIAELDDYMKNHLGDAVKIKAKITATRKELWDVRDKLNDKKMKLEQAGMKALTEIADIYPRMTNIHDSSLFDDSFAMDFLNYGDKVIYCAMYLYVGYVNEAFNFAESLGGSSSDTKDWGRDKDEDEIEWIRRSLRLATRMVKPRKDKGLGR